MARILGIDLGTTNSCVAVFESGAARVIDSAEGEPTTPSAVGEDAAGKLYVGAPARWQAQTNPEFTFTGLKRLLGRSFTDPVVGEQMEAIPYVIEEGPNGEAWVRTRQGLVAPQQILAHVLRKLKAAAEAHFGDVVGHCVLTVPAHFGQAQRAAAQEAATQAGLEVLRLMPEPSAAALAYGFQKASRTFAVFDFGGGTFDVAVLRAGGGDFEVLSTAGNPFLGGEDFDRRILAHLADRFRAQHGIELRQDRAQLQRLRDEAEKAKIRLSSIESYTVMLPYCAVHAETGRKLDLVDEVTRAQLEELTADLVALVKAPCEEALARARLDARDLDDVVLVGGMTAMPAIRQAVVEIFGREPRKDVNPEQVVAIGAAIRAAALSGEVRKVNIAEPLAHSIGVEDGDGALAILLKARTVTPTRKAMKFTTRDDGQTAVAVPLFEGELPTAADNRSLGVLLLTGIAPAGLNSPGESR
jgi:molecular chaperone DnaK